MHDLAHALVAASPDGVIVADGCGRILAANPAAAVLTGRPADQLIGMRVDELIGEDLAGLARRTAHETAPPIDLAHAPIGLLCRDDGTRRRVETTVVRLDLEEGPSVALYLRPLPDEPSLDEVAVFRRLLDAVVTARELPEVLDIAARGACELFGADSSSVVRVDPATDSVEVIAACGSMAHFLDTRVPLEGTRVQTATEQGVPVHFVNGGLLQQRVTQGQGPSLGELWIAPLTVDGAPFGALTIASDAGRRMRAETHERLEPFVQMLTQAIEITEAAHHRSALAVVADHERIARDLHDVVIQRLIAAAMRLEAMLRQVDNVLQVRLNGVIDDLDRVTRDIRTTVFHLQRNDDDSRDLARQINEVVVSTGEAFGLQISCQVHQGAPGELPEGLRAHLLAVAREAVSNVGRHAHATHVDVEAYLDNPLVLTVIDDGTGLEPGALPGNGLRNLATRAAELGGQLTIEPAATGGTSLRWEIPLPSEHARGDLAASL